MKNGKIVVEVDKVVRDLTMLQHSFKTSKFFRVLAPSTEPNEEENANRQSGADPATEYRNILNKFFRSFVSLNNSVEDLGTENDVCR